MKTHTRNTSITPRYTLAVHRDNNANLLLAHSVIIGKSIQIATQQIENKETNDLSSKSPIYILVRFKLLLNLNKNINE